MTNSSKADDPMSAIHYFHSVLAELNLGEFKIVSHSLNLLLRRGQVEFASSSTFSSNIRHYSWSSVPVSSQIKSVWPMILALSGSKRRLRPKWIKNSLAARAMSQQCQWRRWPWLDLNILLYGRWQKKPEKVNHLVSAHSEIVKSTLRYTTRGNKRPLQAQSGKKGTCWLG